MPRPTNPRKQPSEALIRHVVPFKRPMPTPVRETEPPHHVVVLYPPEQHQKVAVAQSSPIFTRSVEDTLAAADVPQPVARRLGVVLSLLGVNATFSLPPPFPLISVQQVAYFEGC